MNDNDKNKQRIAVGLLAKLDKIPDKKKELVSGLVNEIKETVLEDLEKNSLINIKKMLGKA